MTEEEESEKGKKGKKKKKDPDEKKPGFFKQTRSVVISEAHHIRIIHGIYHKFLILGFYA